MGTGNNYSSQIDSALGQANTPKSGLSQEYSGLLGGVAPGILHSLLNTQNLGNSFLNVNGAGSGGGTRSNSPYVNNFHPDAYNPPNVHPFTMNGGSNSAPPSLVAPQGSNVAGDPGWWQSSGLATLQNLFQQQTGRPITQNEVNSIGQAGAAGMSWDQGDNSVLSMIKNNYMTPPQNSSLGSGATPNFGPGGLDQMMVDRKPTIPYGTPTVPGTGIQGGTPTVEYPNLGGGTTTRPPNSQNYQYQGPSDYEQGFGQQSGAFGIGQGQQGGININGFRGAAPTLQGMNTQGMNPQALMTLLQQNISPGTNYANNQNTNTSPQIQQLLQMIGGQPQNVNAQQIGQSGFNQQMANPGQINAQFNPNSINPGQVNAGFNQQMASPVDIQNPGFQAQGANLSGINTGTELSGGSQDSYNAIANILQNQQKQAMADQHERFTGIGGARGTGASLADAQLQSQMQPQLAQALNSARNNEVSNQLQSAGLQSSNALANSGMMNQYGLGGAQLDVQRQGQNASNFLNAIGINNQYGLGGAQLGAQTGLSNVQNQLQANQQNNQFGLNSAQLNSQNQGQNVQNYLQSLGINNQYGLVGAQLNSQNQQANQSANLQGQMANQSAGLQNQGLNNNLLAQLLGQQGTNSNNANNYSLGQNQLNSQNTLATLGLNQQGATSALNAQNQNQGTVNQGNLGMNQILSQLSQANASGANAFNLGTAGMNQSAAQQQIQNQMQSLMGIFGMGSGMANAGIPGGSANVNIGNSAGSNFGSNMAGLASILSMFG